MKFLLHSIIFLLLFSKILSASLIEAPIIRIDDKNLVTVTLAQKLDRGISGFVVHQITPQHSLILKNATLISYDENNKTAQIRLYDFTLLKNTALPNLEYKVAVGDYVALAFGYNRGVLIAPSEEIYHQITHAVAIEWVHPDLFATVLSFNGHPTPLLSDFKDMSNALDVGLVFLFLDQKVYTLDAKSFKILAINDAKFSAKKKKLPFYTRVNKIEANWFGEGSDEMEAYAPHYYDLLVQRNKKNKQLFAIIKDSNRTDLLDKFEIGK